MDGCVSPLTGVLGSGAGDGRLPSPGKRSRSSRLVAASSLNGFVLNGFVLTNSLVNPSRTKKQDFDSR